MYAAFAVVIAGMIVHSLWKAGGESGAGLACPDRREHRIVRVPMGPCNGHDRLMNRRPHPSQRETFMIRTLAAAALATSLVSGSALAQEKLFRTVKATPGQQMPLGQVGLIKRDCSVGPLPDIRVLTPPKQGTLAIRERTTKAGDIKRCPKLETTVRGVLYRANAGTSGTDEVVYEVKRADGSIQSMTVRIEIGTGPATGGASQDAADL